MQKNNEQDQWKTATGKKKKGKQFKATKSKKLGFGGVKNINPFDNPILQEVTNPFVEDSKKFTKKKHTLLVRNFGDKLTRKDLKEHFSQFSEVKKLKIFNKDEEEKAYALLAFKKRKDVMWILKNPTTHCVNGTELECRLAIEEDEYESIKKRQQDSLFTIFLNKVPGGIDETELSDYFSKYGEIKSVCLINKNKIEDTDKKFGFVLFEKVECVKLALAQKSHTIKNLAISCTRYWPKEKNVKSVIINKKGKIMKEAEEEKKILPAKEPEKEIEVEEKEEEEVSKGKRVFAPVEEKTEVKVKPCIVWIEGSTEKKFRIIGILNICEKLYDRHKKLLKLPSGERLTLLRLNKQDLNTADAGLAQVIQTETGLAPGNIPPEYLYHDPYYAQAYPGQEPVYPGYHEGYPQHPPEYYQEPYPYAYPESHLQGYSDYPPPYHQEPAPGYSQDPYYHQAAYGDIPPQGGYSGYPQEPPRHWPQHSIGNFESYGREGYIYS